MAVITNNSNALPDTLLGISAYNIVLAPETPLVTPDSSIPIQVAGLSPLNPCCSGEVEQSISEDCGCEGSFRGDIIPNTFDYVLPAFDNDTSLWVLQYPLNYDAIAEGDFTLQKWNGTAWVNISTLNNTTYGTPFNNGYSNNYNWISCDGSDIPSSDNFNYQGFLINWESVYSNNGAGIYKFVVYGTSINNTVYCLSSLPYCLKTGTCASQDRTIKFKMQNCGGTMGDPDDQTKNYSLCLTNSITEVNEFRAQSGGTIYFIRATGAWIGCLWTSHGLGGTVHNVTTGHDIGTLLSLSDDGINITAWTGFTVNSGDTLSYSLGGTNVILTPFSGAWQDQVTATKNTNGGTFNANNGTITALNEKTVGFSEATINIGGVYNIIGDQYIATNNPIQVFSGRIATQLVQCGTTITDATLILKLYKNGVILYSMNISLNPAATGIQGTNFTFPQTDGIGGNPTPLSAGDVINLYVEVDVTYTGAPTCGGGAVEIITCMSGSFWENNFESAGANPVYFPLEINDSIRLFGRLADQSFEIQRDEIKYQTGAINKVRDELVKNYILKLGGNNIQKLPLSLLNRFAAYCMTADQLKVTDYNLNNPDYGIIDRIIVAESGFKPKFTGDSRYGKVDDLIFKDGIQAIYRDRCCG